MRLDLVRDAAAVARLPEVLAERCVHSLIERATCRRCVDACPTEAWVIDDERLGIDPARCDGCGLCAPACPQAAIVGVVEPVRVGGMSVGTAGRSAALGASQDRGQGAAPTGPRKARDLGRNAAAGGSAARGAMEGPAALLACERAWADPDRSAVHGAIDPVGRPSGRRGDGAAPCVHALGLRDLARLAATGCRRLVVSTGDCDTCPRGGAVRLETRLADLARLLDSRGLPLLRVERLPADRWQVVRDAGVPDAGPAMGRRSFLRRGVGLAVEHAVTAFDLAAAERQALDTAAALLPETDAPRALAPIAPVIDPAACTGCDACARLCPQEAIRRETSEGAMAYRVVPARCTGCGICVDVCADAAVRLTEWIPVAPSSIPLMQAVCSSCRAPFHRPVVDAGEAPVRCPVCETRGARDRSFRVQE